MTIANFNEMFLSKTYINEHRLDILDKTDVPINSVVIWYKVKFPKTALYFLKL